jgi:hypothetical protein
MPKYRSLNKCNEVKAKLDALLNLKLFDIVLVTLPPDKYVLVLT